MKTVFIVYLEEKYSNPHVVGVFSSESLAESFKLLQIKQDEVDTIYDYYYVLEHVVFNDVV